ESSFQELSVRSGVAGAEKSWYSIQSANCCRVVLNLPYAHRRPRGDRFRFIFVRDRAKGLSCSANHVRYHSRSGTIDRGSDVRLTPHELLTPVVTCSLRRSEYPSDK